MTYRCFWCDSDSFKGVNKDGEYQEIKDIEITGETPIDYVCAWCGHLSSEKNPRLGDPKETVTSLKEERDELRSQLEQCMAEQTDPDGIGLSE